ncbi:MAG TPA: L-threonylcarbamoyladenylate synthase [Puia sp.]|uniref:L-threonylcarbamoyladenylate synthase n=1 Tax=Puia sp. TaxID=2045100 RepID=UPI002CA61615|nr:L-threonylcarbamoyladenylate synthase [Puia sp.]HVU98761.1 L-threonylcarbamoyladenylate synthase [Puia sp.]
MLLHLHPENPQIRNIKMVVECLLDGGVIIYPTDTIYGLGCDIFQHKAVERICRIKQVDPAKAQLSFICYDLSDLSNYTKSISTPLYRLLKTYLPGPYTFILPASKQVPKILKSRKDTIGLRIPDNIIARSLIHELGHPILSSSLPGAFASQGNEEKIAHGRKGSDDGPSAATASLWVEEYTDPDMIREKFENQVDIIIDGGIGGMVPSTVVDCTGDEPVLIRKGLGEWVGTES